jgi:hypothetical protein
VDFRLRSTAPLRRTGAWCSRCYTWKVRYVKALLWGNAVRAQEVGLALYHGRVLPLTNRGAAAGTDKQARFALKWS